MTERSGRGADTPRPATGYNQPAQAEPNGTPYHRAALAYLNAGWSPVPLPHKRKSPPPAGFTGYTGHFAEREDVTRWQALGGGNIALRMPETVVGIDTDDYDDKTGGATLAAAEAELGPLPATWRSTARHDDPVSGIRYFRVPGGRQWADKLGDNVEIVHYGHRYGVAAPSYNPDAGDTYCWYDPGGLPADTFPVAGELPELPAAWIARLDRGDVADRPAKVALKDSDAGEWLSSLPAGNACPPVLAVLAGAETALSGGSRHDTARGLMLRLLRLGEQGHNGAVAALDTLEGLWLASLYNREPGWGEWQRMVSGGVATVLAAPTADADRGCCGAPPSAAEDFAEVWDSTPVLDHIRQAAHSRLVSAPALLAYVLGRVLLDVPPDVYLPPTVGSKASLNIGVAVVGGSGSGKSALLDVSRELLGETGEDQERFEKQIGSGEGLVQTFLRRDKETKELVLVPNPRRLVVVDEVDQLGALGSRSGATLGPTIRSALTGGQLGNENADIERRRNVPAKSYRLVLLAGVQPTRSAALLEDSDAGTPQRFLWVRAVDPTIPDAEVEWPGELKWTPPGVTGLLDYPDHIKAVVRSTRLAQQRGAGGELDGHLVLLRLKVGAALALLHGETFISDEWWALAGEIVEASLAVQQECKTVLAAEGQRRSTGAAIAATRAQDAADEDRVKRTAQLVLKKVQEAKGDWVAKHLTRPSTRVLREYMDDAIEVLRLAGQVEVEEYESRGQRGVRLRVAS